MADSESIDSERSKSEQLLELVRHCDAARRALDADDFETASKLLERVVTNATDGDAPQVLRARALQANRDLTASIEQALERTKTDLARVRRGRRFLAKLPAQDSRGE
ncbi:MAG: hypothetical protein AAF196_07930 [Planctomycetota bacterium]